MKRITMFLAAGILFLCSTVYAAVPRLINFQGVVKDSAGNTPLVDQLGITFTIYDAPLGGTALWTESHSVTMVSGGLFNVLLGEFNPIPDSVFADTVRYIGIQVESDPEMSPRQRLSSVGYSYNSSEWTSAGQDLFRLSGNVGIGTSSPGEKLEVNGALKFSGDGNVISRAPRVIRTNDTRAGCPPAAPANVNFLTQNFTLTRPGMVFITVDMVRRANGRADLELWVDGATAEITIADTPALEWQGASVHWSGTLGAGAHTVSLRSPQASVWGCGSTWGGINTIIFE